MKIEEIIRRDHGSNCILALGPSALDIIEEHQQLLDNGGYRDPLSAIYGEPEEVAAQDAYNRIRGAVLNNWLSVVPRDQMIAVLNVVAQIPGGGFVQYLPGESLSVTLLMDEWNKANPEDKPISINSNYMP